MAGFSIDNDHNEYLGEGDTIVTVTEETVTGTVPTKPAVDAIDLEMTDVESVKTVTVRKPRD